MFRCRDRRENIADVDLVLKVNLVYKFQYIIYSPFLTTRTDSGPYTEISSNSMDLLCYIKYMWKKIYDK